MTFWQEGRIEQKRLSDIKYHFILMNGGVTSTGLDSIESWFRDPDKVKIIESKVRDYEERVQETARALDQKHRLEEKSTNSIHSPARRFRRKKPPTKNPENEKNLQPHPTPLSYENHLWTQNTTRRKSC